jgi:starch synthase
LKILFCASEIAPLAKTGGLADVAGALPPELAVRGHDIRLVMPFYSGIDRGRFPTRPIVAPLGVPVGFGQEWCAVHETQLPDARVPVYLIEHNRYFARAGVYQHNGVDYNDNAERFAFFARACCQLCKALDFSPDVMHCHDWQSALVPVYLKTWERDHPLFWPTASVQSIHNLGYQGVFPKDDLVHTQLGIDRFTIDGLEFYGKVNYLKGGILFADKVATVSPTYARQIQLPEYGWALDGVLRARSADLVGILNGCDYREWDPSSDPLLPAHYDVDNLAGKAECKAHLQRVFGLPVRANVPIVGMVSRLAYQKGVDVLAAAIARILDWDLQFVLLGSGEVWAHFFYGGLPGAYPGKAGAYIGYDDVREHLVKAGSDFFLMPSRYEPCGLSQLSSKRYGSLPIVRATGGLEDTVANYNEATGEGDGFKFFDLTGDAIANTVGWAISTFYDRPHHLQAMMKRAMRQRFLWSDAASKYEQLYQWAVARKRGY